jgi:hypothetical protein
MNVLELPSFAINKLAVSVYPIREVLLYVVSFIVIYVEVPSICNLEPGELVPIPTLPTEVIRIRSRVPLEGAVANTMSPLTQSALDPTPVGTPYIAAYNTL